MPEHTPEPVVVAGTEVSFRSGGRWGDPMPPDMLADMARMNAEEMLAVKFCEQCALVVVRDEIAESPDTPGKRVRYLELRCRECGTQCHLKVSEGSPAWGLIAAKVIALRGQHITTFADTTRVIRATL